jgi:hypothetical protein
VNTRIRVDQERGEEEIPVRDEGNGDEGLLNDEGREIVTGRCLSAVKCGQVLGSEQLPSFSDAYDFIPLDLSTCCFSGRGGRSSLGIITSLC